MGRIGCPAEQGPRRESARFFCVGMLLPEEGVAAGRADAFRHIGDISAGGKVVGAVCNALWEITVEKGRDNPSDSVNISGSHLHGEG